jgi:lipid-binding SYLF domain-containing protein
MTETKRPDRTSMQGMIWNAHHILERTLDGKKGLDPGLFGESLVGICFISCVQAGFMFTGNVGTGIVMARDRDNGGKWSPPSAIGLTGVGWGFVMGASVQDIIVSMILTSECLVSTVPAKHAECGRMLPFPRELGTYLGSC